MGRERVLPSALGKTHPTYKTPWNAIFLYIVLSVILVFGILLTTSNPTEIALGGGVNAEGVANMPTSVRGGLYAFAEWATLATPMVMFCYLMLGIAGVLKGSRDGNSRLRNAGVLAALTGAIATYGSLYYSFAEAAPGAGVPSTRGRSFRGCASLRSSPVPRSLST